MVQTPVGARCRECARLYRLPTYRINAVYYLRAGGVALVMAVVTGLVWGVINSFTSFFYLNLLLGAGAGYAIGEVVSLSVNRKRGRWLAVLVGLAVPVSYLVNIFSFGSIPLNLLRIIMDLVALGIGIYLAANRLR
jgi:hypothetical protein